MGLCNLTKVLGSPTNFTRKKAKLSINPGNRYCTYAKRTFEGN